MSVKRTYPASATRLPAIMGVLNVTPDSFSDGGLHTDLPSAHNHIDRLLQEGADIIDIGAESTRPGSEQVDDDEQIRRLGDAVEYAVSKGAVVSIDTTRPKVALHAIKGGATIVNDVSCLRDGDELARVVAAADVGLILMHAREPMAKMRGYSAYATRAYDDVVGDVASELLGGQQRAERAGVSRERTMLDPGLGFNKNAAHSAELVARLEELVALGFSIVVGPSRKSFVSAQVASEPQRRLGGTIAACLACAIKGAAVLRVHDVLEVRQAIAVARSVGLLAVPTEASGDAV